MIRREGQWEISLQLCCSPAVPRLCAVKEGDQRSILENHRTEMGSHKETDSVLLEPQVQQQTLRKCQEFSICISHYENLSVSFSERKIVRNTQSSLWWEYRGQDRSVSLNLLYHSESRSRSLKSLSTLTLPPILMPFLPCPRGP